MGGRWFFRALQPGFFLLQQLGEFLAIFFYRDTLAQSLHFFALIRSHKDCWKILTPQLVISCHLVKS